MTDTSREALIERLTGLAGVLRPATTSGDISLSLGTQTLLAAALDEAAAEIARLRASERAAFRRGVEAAAAWHDGQAATAETLREWTMARRHRSHAAAIRAIEETPT